MSAPLTTKRLDAIVEALTSRLAGERDLDDEAPAQRDYEAALDWALDQIAKRRRRKSSM